ncbi:MAG TPA: YncE family protein [Thermoanaerobaculia bacterium]|nr:YncE family protein [Thermoanaerobaculia bacterium]
MRLPEMFFALLMAAPAYTVHMLPLPAPAAGGIYMDYLAYDPRTGFVWAPAGNTGAVDVVDTATGKVTRIGDFATKEVQVRNGKRTFGPTSATIGKGVVYVGNRADNKICAFDARTLQRRNCGEIDSMPDGLAYSSVTNEVWVTAPRDNSLRILDADTLHQKTKLTYEGNPEGFAVDTRRGRFYTNLEDKDKTLAIDLKTHRTVATWNPNCGSEGPHGIRLDEKSGFLFVACSARVEDLDAARDGKVISSIETGDGVDDIDYSPTTHTVYAGAARAAKLTIAKVDGSGKLAISEQVPTHAGARNGVVTKNGTVYLAHSGTELSDLVVVSPAK